MTLIADGGSRTVYNGSVYGRRKAYAYVADVTIDVTVSIPGTGEVQRTGDVVTEERTYHVIAESEALAAVLVQEIWGSPFHRHRPKSIKPLFVIDGEISHGQK